MTSDATNFKVRRITIHDWQTYKLLRLRSLKLSPEAFGAKLIDSLKLSDQEWQSRVNRFSSSSDAINFLGFVNGKPVGMVSCFIREKAEMVQMWVEPEARGAGLSKLLVEKIKSWTAEQGPRKLYATVHTSNVVALKLYLSCGFKEVASTAAENHTSSANEIQLECDLL